MTTKEIESDLPPRAANGGLFRVDKATRQKLVSLFAVVFGFTVVIMIITELLGGTEKLRATVEQADAWAPGVYILIKIATYIVAPLSGASVELAAGALFGVWAGTALSVVGSTIGGCINYWIARTLGRAGVAKFAGKKTLTRVDETADRVGGWRALLIARIVLSPIYDFVSYAAGLARLPFWQYVAVTFLAGIPINIFFPLLGHASTTSKFVTYALFTSAAILFVIFGVIHLRQSRKSSDT